MGEDMGEDMGEADRLRREIVQLQARILALEKERTGVQNRLELVEELVGPTEAQRKVFQDQIIAARSAALKAHRGGASVPVRFVGRLDEIWLRSMGLSERDCALLQRGCITGAEGVPRDVSLLGDPAFRPYDDASKAPRWEARGGLLRMSLADVRDRWGEEVAAEVVRCAAELDQYDASRRLGLELPWHEAEARELEPAEVIAALERELASARQQQADGRSSSPPPLAADELDSEASSFDVMAGHSPQAGGMSPSWSVMEDSGDFIGGGASGLDATTSASMTPRSPASEPLWPLALGPPPERYADDWSLADADIEQLLRQPSAPALAVGAAGAAAGAAAARRRAGADAARSLLSTPRAEFQVGPEHSADMSSASDEHDGYAEAADEGFAEVLRELLEEEVAGSLGRLLGQSPPPVLSRALGPQARTGNL